MQQVSFFREFGFPNKNTFSVKPIKAFLETEIDAGLWVDPFVRNSIFKDRMWMTNDLNPEFEADFNIDAIEFLKTIPDESVDGVLFDPPYSPRQVKECYNAVGRTVTQEDTQSSFYRKIKEEIQRITKPGAKVIRFGWVSSGIGPKFGFEMTKVMLVWHGGNHNDTIITVETKTLHKGETHDSTKSS